MRLDSQKEWISQVPQQETKERAIREMQQEKMLRKEGKEKRMHGNA